MIKIMTDAAADIETSVAKELGIEILPFMIHLGDKQIRADIDYQPEDYYEELKNTEDMPKTSQMSPADVEEVYRRLCADGSSVIHVTISSCGSGIYNTSSLVAQQLNEEGMDITVVDSQTFSYLIGNAVIEAAKMAKDSCTKEEILDFLANHFERYNAYFVVDDLTFLQKGGRIKATTMAISSILDIKPILSVSDGLVEAYKKVRGLKKAISILVGYVEERMEDPENGEIVILHSEALDKVEIITSMIVAKTGNKNIKLKSIGPIITSHAGMQLVGLMFKHKEPWEKYEKK